MNSQGTHGSFKVEFQLLVVRLNLFVKVLSNIMDEEQVLRFLTKNQTGVLSSLNDLEKCGKIFLYNCMHLLLKQDPSKIKNRNTYQTFLFLESNKNIDVEKNEVLSILSNFVESGGYLFNRKKKRILESINLHIESNRENKKLQKEE